MNIRRVAPVLALGLSASTLISAETPDMYENAAHIPPESCREEIISALGSKVLLDAIELDETNSEEADRPTNSDNNKRVAGNLLEDYPLLSDVIKRDDIETETYTLPESGLQLNVHRIDNNYIFSPGNLDFVMKNIFSMSFENDPLRTATYDCYRREIYENMILNDHEVSVYLIGEGEVCLGRKKVVPRGHTPRLCTAQGRRRSDGVYILSRNATQASSSLIHEIVGHEAQAATNAVPKDDKEYEYFAYEVENEGMRIMNETDRWIYTES